MLVYYLLFRFNDRQVQLKTLGRESEGMEMKLHTKAEYKEKQEGKKNAKGRRNQRSSDRGSLGGAGNIVKVDNCFTRLRLIVKDNTLVQMMF